MAANGFQWATDKNFVNGDIIVWGDDPGTMTGKEGHIAVYYNGKIFDQNDYQAGRNVTDPRAAGLSPWFSAGYLGRWRK